MSLGSLPVEGRKERTTGAEGSFGRREADGLRVQCWPHISLVLVASASPSESESDSKSVEEDDAASKSSSELGRKRSSCPERTKVSMWPDRSLTARILLSAEKAACVIVLS